MVSHFHGRSDFWTKSPEEAAAESTVPPKVAQPPVNASLSTVAEAADPVTLHAELALSSELGTLPPELASSAELGTLPPELASSAELGTLPPGLVSSPELGTLPPGLASSPELGTLPPGLVSSSKFGILPPGLVSSPKLGTLPPELASSPELGTLPPELASSPELGTLPPELALSEASRGTQRGTQPNPAESRTTVALSSRVALSSNVGLGADQTEFSTRSLSSQTVMAQPEEEHTSLTELASAYPSSTPVVEQSAHQLLIELAEAPVAAGRGPAQDKVGQVRAEGGIANAIIEAPEYVPPRPLMSPWATNAIWYTCIGFLGLTLLVMAYGYAMEAPVPEVKITPELTARRQRIERAVLALELGHRYAGKQGDEERAISAYEEALHYYPKMADAERGLAITLTKVGEKLRASRHFERYLQLTPDAEDARQIERILGRWRAEWDD